MNNKLIKEHDAEQEQVARALDAKKRIIPYFARECNKCFLFFFFFLDMAKSL